MAGLDWFAEEGGRPFLHPGRAASIVARESERKLGWLGELHPLVAREWDVPGPVAGFELDVEAMLEVTAGRQDVYRDVTSFPAVLQDIAVVVPDAVSAAELEEAVRAGGGELLTGVEVFDLYRGEQAGEGNKSLALRLEFRAPDRTLTDEEVAGGARRSSASWARSGGGSVPERPATVAVIGAAGFGGAVAAAISRRHPSIELTAVTARSDAGRRHDEIYPRYRVPLELETFDPDAIAERADSALVAYPHKAAAPAVRALRERGLKVVDLSADFRLDQAAYEHWYQPHEAPELLAEAVYGLPEAHREEIREAELVAGPGCNSTAAMLALLPLRGRIEEAVVDIKAGVSGAGREATEETHFVSATDNVNPYKTEGHRHVAELQQELPGVRFSFVPHLLPIDQGMMASCYATPTEPLTRDEACASCTPRPMPTSRSWS